MRGWALASKMKREPTERGFCTLVPTLRREAERVPAGTDVRGAEVVRAVREVARPVALRVWPAATRPWLCTRGCRPACEALRWRETFAGWEARAEDAPARERALWRGADARAAFLLLSLFILRVGMGLSGRSFL